jgi:hypothetical protein
MNQREQFHGVGRGLYKGGLYLCLALIGLLLGAPLGVGQSRAATLQEIEAEIKNLNQKLVQLKIDFNNVEALKIDAIKKLKAGDPDADRLKLLIRTDEVIQEDYRKAYAVTNQRRLQLSQQRDNLVAAMHPPATAAEAIAFNVGQQNLLRHNLNLLMKLEAQALGMAQSYQQSGDQERFIAWMREKDALTARIGQFQQKLREFEAQEQALRQGAGPKGAFNVDMSGIAKDLEKMGTR